MAATACPWRAFALKLGIPAAFFAALAAVFFRQHPLPIRAMAGLYLCLMLLVAMAAAPAIPAARELIAGWLGGRARVVICLGLWITPYLIYAAGTGDFRMTALTRQLAIAAPPLFLYLAFPIGDPHRFAWQDALAWSWLELTVMLGRLGGIWTVPANLDFMARLFLLTAASWLWTFVRPVPGLGYNLSISRVTVRAAAINFLLFAMVAIPAALGIGFAHWSPRWPGLWNVLAAYLEILIFIAWIEELFFRGVLQNLLTGNFGSPASAQLAASCIFGFSHILHAPVPNWRYAFLATLAGWFYGRAWRQGEGLPASSLAHAAVDTVWRTWFGR